MTATCGVCPANLDDADPNTCAAETGLVLTAEGATA